MSFLDIAVTGSLFILFYSWFGVTELVSFAALGTFLLAYLAWIVVEVIFVAIVGLLFGKLKNNKVQEETGKYDDYILAEEEEDGDNDDDIGIHISFD